MKPLELAIHRKATAAFIEADKTTLVLIPTNEVETYGTKEYIDQPPRVAQDFKFIYPAPEGGRVTTADGQRFRFDFILVGKHNAVVSIGDHWTESEQIYVVEWVAPYNGYEVKAGGSAHGSSPAHG